MNSRKRQATESLLPFRAPKSPKTSRSRCISDNMSSAEETGILSRWADLWHEAWNLGRETLSHVIAGPNAPPPSHLATPDQPRLPPSGMPQRPPIPTAFQQSMDPPQYYPPSLARHSESRQSDTVMSDGTTATSPPSTATWLASTSSMRISQLDDLLAASQYPNARPSGCRPFKDTRRHIYGPTHEANLKLQRLKDRDAMTKELYEMRRATGYQSDLRTFKDYLLYYAEQERLARQETIRASPSLSDLRSSTPQRHRRHSAAADLNSAFLERALRKARDALNGPKPPKPYMPAYDQFRLSTRAKDDEIERRIYGPKYTPLPSSLPPEDDAQVNSFLKQRGIISKYAREQVTDTDIARLEPSQWLNDEIINFYGAMILGRSEGSKENPGMNGVSHGRRKPLNVHYFSTFFWSKLKGEGYEKARLAKWTKKFDIFAKDVALIPVNHSNAHWSAAAINFRRKRIESYDSLGLDRTNVCKALRGYVDAEHRNKKKRPFDFTGWVDCCNEDTPTQENGYDCGVFTCCFLEALSRGEESFNFTQRDMPYLRRRMIWEIGNMTLYDP